MGTKEQVLALLKENHKDYLSGEELAEKLGISRAAVCKACKALRDQGCEIHAVTRKGYRLLTDPDLADPEKILSLTDGDFWKIRYYDSLPSTNSFLRDLAAQGAPEGTVILSGTQSAGRGRMGRTFYSPPNTGLYCSLLLRPTDFRPEESLQITTMAAAALCLAIEEVTGKQPQIKWVNDLFLNGKKICGILTEASFSMETGRIDYAVLGIGLNLCAPEEGFPSSLSSIAGALLDRSEPELKNRLTAGFLNHFSDFYRSRRFGAAAEIYRSRSLLTGKTVLVEGQEAKVLEINDRCQLVVEYSDGTRKELSYGEVSIVNLT